MSSRPQLSPAIDYEPGMFETEFLIHYALRKHNRRFVSERFAGRPERLLGNIGPKVPWEV